MAKINIQIPEPKNQYSVEDQRQIQQALRTLQSQLNFSYENDIKNENDTFNYFLSWRYNIKIKELT